MKGIDLTGVALFDGLATRDLDDVAERMTPRRFEVRAQICRQGEAGKSLFVIRRGVAQVEVTAPEGPMAIGRLRRGDVFGEMSLLTDEPRSASVVAKTPTEVFELDQAGFADVLGRHPALFKNLSRILSGRLARANRDQAGRTHRGEAIALVVTNATRSMAADVAAAAVAASARGVAVLDVGAAPASSEIADVLGTLDDLLATSGTVVAVVHAAHDHLRLLVDQVDRVVTLSRHEEVASLRAGFDGGTVAVETAVLGDGHPRTRGALRTIDPVRPGPDIAWLGRHLSRTKLGLALGAGGAKGFAHVGVLSVIEAAGYTVDYVSGSSIGAIVGTCLGLGMDAGAIDSTLRDVFTPDTVKTMFNLSFGGGSSGQDLLAGIWRDLVGDRSFADLVLPVVIMAVDLDARLPAPMTDGPLWDAVMAATALAGFVPPHHLGERRLVDALALVPVPIEAVKAAGADVTLSVNLVSRRVLDAWPGEPPPEPPGAPRRQRMLDTMLEVLDLAQLESSIRHAAKADVVVEPSFGPASWRDFHRADLFLAAGRGAAEEMLPALLSLARPQSTPTDQGGTHAG